MPRISKSKETESGVVARSRTERAGTGTRLPVGTQLLGVLRMLWDWLWRWPHSSVNVLTASELYALGGCMAGERHLNEAVEGEVLRAAHCG